MLNGQAALRLTGVDASGQTSAATVNLVITRNQKVGNFTIKYTSLDDASAAKGGDWDGTVEQSNANKAINDPDTMVYVGTYNSGAAKLSDQPAYKATRKELPTETTMLMLADAGPFVTTMGDYALGILKAAPQQRLV